MKNSTSWRYRGICHSARAHENYKKFISRDLEPVLHVPGATFVGLNTSQGVTPETLTWNVRDISIIGHIRAEQFDVAEEAFNGADPADARVIVMHHNPVKGELSQRHGLKATKKILGRFAQIRVDLVLCGHDHQESVHYIEHTKKGTVISTAGTVSSRSRGGRPSSVNVISIGEATIDVTTRISGSARVIFNSLLSLAARRDNSGVRSELTPPMSSWRASFRTHTGSSTRASSEES